MLRVLAAWDEHVVDPYPPRRLTGLLEEAGFTVARREVVPILNAGYDPQTFSAGVISAWASSPTAWCSRQTTRSPPEANSYEISTHTAAVIPVAWPGHLLCARIARLVAEADRSLERFESPLPPSSSSPTRSQSANELRTAGPTGRAASHDGINSAQCATPVSSAPCPPGCLSCADGPRSRLRERMPGALRRARRRRAPRATLAADRANWHPPARSRRSHPRP